MVTHGAGEMTRIPLPGPIRAPGPGADGCGMRASWGDALGTAYELVYQGWIEKGLDQARTHLATAERAGDSQTVARSHAVMGLALSLLQRPQESLLCAHNSAHLFEQLGNPQGQAFSQSVAASSYLELGDTVEAKRELAHAEQLLTGDHDEPEAFAAWIQASRVYARLSQYGHALDAAAQAAALGADMPVRYQVEAAAQQATLSIERAVECYHLDVTLGTAQLSEAIAAAADVAAEIAKTDSHRCHYELLLQQGTGLALLGLHEPAQDALRQSLELASTLGLASERDAVRLRLAAAARLCGRYEEAKAHLDAVGRLGDGSASMALQIEYFQEYSGWCEATGRHEQALEAYKSFHELSMAQLKARADAQNQVMSVRMGTNNARLQNQFLKVRNRDLERSVKTLTDQTEALNEQAFRDPLTGLGNRRFYADQIALLTQGDTGYMVGILDLDHFKAVNDTYGHATGDAVLVQVAQILGASCRPGDPVCRYGGEEFVVVLVGADEPIGAMVAERLRRAVAGHDWQALHPDLAVTVSIGLAAGDPADPEAAIERADQALYEAKRGGRNRVRVQHAHPGPVAAAVH
ncbi:MAG: hypothetical protein CSA58_11665 [Micrococcales bacterium]|nr:MAG: hypothetical protein CSA58_11665 [Micrococcales bacterium]